jgi:hypothetical protein
MGKLHWQLQNHFQHHGGAGFHALGYDPARDLRQDVMDFMFDDDALARSETAVLEQIPRLIFEAAQSGQSAIELETLFAARCNDTPVTSDISRRQLIVLRDQGELAILGPDATPRQSARNLAWTDRIILYGATCNRRSWSGLRLRSYVAKSGSCHGSAPAGETVLRSRQADPLGKATSRAAASGLDGAAAGRRLLSAGLFLV